MTDCMPADHGRADHGLADILDRTTRMQRRAADPTASAWVAANAGTGKTYVLTQRVLRLLLSGTPPARILCLTFTKAAAAEMSTRVFDTLASWVGMSPEKLDTALAQLTGTVPDSRQTALARTLFTAAIETPGGFKVQTIHAFAERLLQRFPLEAGVPPGFTILDDTAAGALLRQSIDATLAEATADRDAPLGRALATAVRYVADDSFDQVMREAVAAAGRPRGGVTGAATGETDDVRLARTERELRAAFTLAPGRTSAGAAAEMEALLDEVTLRRLVGALRESSSKDRKLADRLAPAIGATGSARRAALTAFFLTAKGEPRVDPLTKPFRAAHPDLTAIVERALERCARLEPEMKALQVVEATVALHRLAAAARARFTAFKADRAALDFDDLVARTVHLMAGREATAWVLYKLDGGIDHVLVDEAQDTSPDQWRIVAAIVEEFFGDAGVAAGRDATARTVFAVGDEKQSIYSFQGAAPEMFAATGRRFEALARAAGGTWHQAALTLSFRTVDPVLETVDTTFADHAVTPGVALGDAAAIRHEVRRVGQAGLVEVWPPERPDPPADTDAWAPLDEEAASSPVTRLARRIARTVQGWLSSGERLASEDRPIRPGDVLVLVRKRAPIAPAVVAALKAAGVPVAGSDRITITRQIAVEDLMALGDVLTLPEDDLALAAVLKSPLFGLDDDDLLRLAHGRKGTLWRELLDAAAHDHRSGAAAEQLKRWRAKADFLPPYELYATVLDRDGGRKRLLERLGPEAADGLDEFMNLALRFDDEEAPSLTGFLAWLREDERTIKRDMDQGRGEVRVMTVHGAKGLEAPIVFLPDTCARPSAGKRPLLPLERPAVDVWTVKGTSCLPLVDAAKARLADADAQEEDRLLYVALTRARDRLYLAGVQGKDALPDRCWYALVTRALDTRLVPAVHPDGGAVRRLATAQTAPCEREKGGDTGGAQAPPRPRWATTPAPRERQPTIPFAPSRLALYDYDASGEPVARPDGPQSAGARDTPPPPVGRDDGDVRFLRGTLTHALLQHLPGLPPAAWQKAAEGYVARRGSALPSTVRANLVTEALTVLRHPSFWPLFTPDSRAEVPVVAELPDPNGRGPPLRLVGQLDRLAVGESTVLIVDYKTNRTAPDRIEDVAESYLAQLAAYRAALALVYPQHTVRAALLWTAVPRLMEVPADVLDGYGSRLWELAAAKLDLAEVAS
jgi:ATP-dependent helicase/nuclease subunit A